MCEEKKALKERLGAIMKIKKHTCMAVIFSIVLLMAITLTACVLGARRANNADFPTVTVSYNGKSAVIPLGEKEQIPYVELGSTVSIDFGGARPSSVSVIEVITNADGSRKYGEQTDKALDVELSGSNLATFVIEINIGDLFSSNSHDYQAGNAWRWYRIICNDDGKSVTEYGLWLRTDPATIIASEIPSESGAPYPIPSDSGFITLNDLRELTAKADKYRTPLGAVSAEFTVRFKDGAWTADEPEMVWMS